MGLGTSDIPFKNDHFGGIYVSFQGCKINNMHHVGRFVAPKVEVILEKVVWGDVMCIQVVN